MAEKNLNIAGFGFSVVFIYLIVLLVSITASEGMQEQITGTDLGDSYIKDILTKKLGTNYLDDKDSLTLGDPASQIKQFGYSETVRVNITSTETGTFENTDLETNLIDGNTGIQIFEAVTAIGKATRTLAQFIGLFVAGGALLTHMALTQINSVILQLLALMCILPLSIASYWYLGKIIFSNSRI